MASQTNRTKMNIYASITILIWATAFPVTRMIGDEIDQYAVVLMCWNGVLSINVGALWTLSAAFLFFIYNMLTRELTKELTSLEVVTFAMTVAAVSLLVFVPHTIGVIQQASISAVLWAIYLGVLPSAVSYFFWAKAMDYADKTSSVTNFMFITPILATILGLIMLHEAPDAGTFIGGGIIIASLIVFNLKR